MPISGWQKLTLGWILGKMRSKPQLRVSSSSLITGAVSQVTIMAAPAPSFARAVSRRREAMSANDESHTQRGPTGGATRGGQPFASLRVFA